MERSSDGVFIANPTKEVRLVTSKLGERGLQALVSAGHVFTWRKLIELKEVSNQPVILGEAQSNTCKVLEQTFKSKTS